MSVILIIAICGAIAAGVYARVFFRRFILERREFGRVVALFSRYVPAPVVEDLLARKDPRLYEAREYYATIVSIRVRNFALFSETLGPEETLRYLNEVYTIAGQAVQRHRGMIESLRGDRITAVFGVLVEEQFQEERALRAALEIMRMMKAMESRWAAQGRKPLTVGIGINSGKIVAGDTGFQNRREFAIVGNPTHVASRLEAASEELNATIIASETTYDAVRELFVGVPTSSLPLRGLRRLHNAYIIRGLTRRAGEESLLTLPSQRSFRKTIVHEAEESRAEPGDYLAPDDRGIHVDVTNAPASVPVTQHVRALEPERHRFSQFDDSTPALPEVPPIVGTYEDDQGPPFQLPP